jgi:hypothetical protein
MKNIFYSLCLACLITGCTAEDQHPRPPADVPKVVVDRIEKLDKDISHYEKQAMDDEVNSMGAFRANYSKFAEEFEASEGNEEKVRELEHEKEALLKQVPETK